jgi:protoheme IX farnesyltransferase
VLHFFDEVNSQKPEVNIQRLEDDAGTYRLERTRKYRDDYARGGIRMLPVIEPDGASTAKRIVACSILLIPISLAPHLLDMTGSIYAAAAVAGALGLLYFGVRLGRDRSLARARHVLLASVLYLPLLLAVMVIDRS